MKPINEQEQFVITSTLGLGKFELRFDDYQDAVDSLASLGLRFPEVQFDLQMPKSATKQPAPKTKKQIPGFTAHYERRKKQS